MVLLIRLLKWQTRMSKLHTYIKSMRRRDPISPHTKPPKFNTTERIIPNNLVIPNITLEIALSFGEGKKKHVIGVLSESEFRSILDPAFKNKKSPKINRLAIHYNAAKPTTSNRSRYRALKSPTMIKEQTSQWIRVEIK